MYLHSLFFFSYHCRKFHGVRLKANFESDNYYVSTLSSLSKSLKHLHLCNGSSHFRDDYRACLESAKHMERGVMHITLCFNPNFIITEGVNLDR